MPVSCNTPREPLRKQSDDTPEFYNSQIAYTKPHHTSCCMHDFQSVLSPLTSTLSASLSPHTHSHATMQLKLIGLSISIYTISLLFLTSYFPARFTLFHSRLSHPLIPTVIYRIRVECVDLYCTRTRH